jgi:hypothetical protein
MGRMRTLRFLHDLQFMASRGSFAGWRAGSRSMLTCGRGMATGIGRAVTGGQCMLLLSMVPYTAMV